jgi:hypothetical protein
MVHDPLDSEDMAEKVRGVGVEDHACSSLRYGLMLEAMPDVQRTKVRSFEFREGG